MKPLFTVILAGYRSEPWLPKALDSVATQTFRDFEAICYVEDSPDRSLAICEDMVRRDPRFKVATGPKSGAVATTRNYGIDHAAGEYLVVLDGDDWIAPDMLEKLERKLRQTGPLDVLAFAAVATTDDTVDWAHALRLTNFRPSDEDGVFTGFDAIRRAGRNGGQMHNQTVLCAYRVAFLRQHALRQTDGLLMEDFESTPRIWFHAARFAYLDAPFYAYRRRANSLTSEASSRLVRDLARQLASLLAFADGHDVPNDILSVWSNQWVSILLWFLFHPASSRKVPDADRRLILRSLLSGDNAARFRKAVARASHPKRLALPLLRLAAAGWTFPAKCYFRSIYYPLVARRASKGGLT